LVPNERQKRYRRLADAGCLGEGGDAQASGLLRVVEDHFGHLAFGLVQVVQAALDLFQQVAHAVHRGS